MGRAKEITVKVIPSDIANKFVEKYHYSGKVVNNSKLHFGAFLDGKLHGVLSYGCSMDKKRTILVVKDTRWDGYLELNRMAFDEYLPKNSESRCIGITIRMIKKQAPQIKWILSYADGCQCGDGTIYRASGFCLVGIKKNNSLLKYKNKVIAKKTLDDNNQPKINGKYLSGVLTKSGEAIPLEGYQLKYIYFIDKEKQKDLTVPILPFSAIQDAGAGMYKGIKR